jgi:alpha-beta hydrolase superfamily lysophospholipase
VRKDGRTTANWGHILDRYDRYVESTTPRVDRRSTFWGWRGERVHVERVGDPAAPVRILLVHGAGGNADALWPYAARLSTTGAYVSIPDLLGYGQTVAQDPGAVRYDDWRRMLFDLVRAEHDDRPLLIIGASMGGMLAYDTAAETGLASAIAVTCLLDPRSPAVRARLTWHPLLARVAGPALRAFAGPLANLRLPIRWIADMRHISNDPELVREVLADRRGGGGRVSLGWMRSFLESQPVQEPEAFTTPVHLLHPSEDLWTPVDVSMPFFDRIAADTSLVMLEGCGHFPLEQPGFDRMVDEVRRIVERLRG